MNQFGQSKTTIFLYLVCASGLLLGGCANQVSSEIKASDNYAVSSEDYNKLVVMEYMEALSTAREPEIFAEILSPDYKELRPEFANMNYHAAGSELATVSDPMNIAIKNRRNRVDAYIAEGNQVIVRYYISGIHAGNFYGIPATDKEFEILAAAIFWLENGKITQSWSMADEAGFLRQIGKPLPARADGRWEAWPTVLPARTGDDLMAEQLANPEDSQEYRNKLQQLAWKAPAYREQILHKDQSQRTGLRSGFFHLANAASASAIREYPFLAAFPDRVDMITNLLADGKRVVIQFRLTATNSQSLFGIPAQNKPVAAYEFGFQEFDGEVWKYNFWFGDDLGMLLQIGGPTDYWFQNQPSGD